MGDRTGISWCDATWNPLVGCTRVSEGCRYCYAERDAIRISGPGQKYEGVVKSTTVGPRWTGVVRLVEDALDIPLRWKRPRRIFVNSMSDLFHEKAPDEWIDRIFAVMARCRRHTFQILTKRPERMLRYLTRPANPLADAWWRWTYHMPDLGDTPLADWDRAVQTRRCPEWIWLGVSVEDQATADARIPLLLQTPAAVRWVSYEPALASVDFSRWVFDRKAEVNRLINGPAMLNRDQAEASVSYPLDWLVVGGESGRDARPPHPDWFRSARNQCGAVGVPFFFKQWGEWREHPEPPMRGYNNGAGLYVLPNGKFGCQGDYWNGTAAGMDRVGKKAAGALLDGREWKEWPR